MMQMKTWCRWKNNQVLLDGELFFQADAHSSDDMPLQLYRFLRIDYPKFHKMDLLCKTGLLMSEILKSKFNLSDFADNEIAMLFANNHSCSDTDNKFERSYKNEKAPSPALFVYTLPNIVAGEISIRNKWYGESVACIIPEFDSNFYQIQMDILNPGSKAVMAGWLRAAPHTDAFVYFAEKTRETTGITEQLAKAYHSL